MSTTVEISKETEEKFMEVLNDIHDQGLTLEVEIGSTADPASSFQTDNSDAIIQTQKELDHQKSWGDAIKKISDEIELAKEQRKEASSFVRHLEKKREKIIAEGPQGMFNRPLLDLAEEPRPEQQATDSEIWRQTPIDQLELPEKLLAKTGDHFRNIGQLVDWLNNPLREKKERLGKKAIEQLQEAVNKFHEPVLQAELASSNFKTQSAKCDIEVQSELDQLFALDLNECRYFLPMSEKKDGKGNDFTDDEIQLLNERGVTTLGDLKDRLEFLTKRDHDFEDDVNARNYDFSWFELGKRLSRILESHTGKHFYHLSRDDDAIECEYATVHNMKFLKTHVWSDFLKEIDELLSDGRYEFAIVTLEGIRQWVQENEHFTTAQLTAVENIRNSIEV